MVKKNNDIPTLMNFELMIPETIEVVVPTKAMQLLKAPAPKSNNNIAKIFRVIVIGQTGGRFSIPIKKYREKLISDGKSDKILVIFKLFKFIF